MDTFSEAANAPGAFAPLLTMSKILPAAPCAGAPVGTAVTVLDDPALSLTMSENISSEAAKTPGAFAPLLTMSKILPAAPCAGAPVGTAVTVHDDSPHQARLGLRADSRYSPICLRRQVQT